MSRGRSPRHVLVCSARLQALLRDIRRWLGNRDWDIEWADDGRICWLVQLRPITRPPRRDETFSIANHKEILPGLPSPFMTSIVESCAYELYGYYRDFDPVFASIRNEPEFKAIFAGIERDMAQQRARLAARPKGAPLEMSGITH